jgi:Mg2+-importing ATPase
MAPSQRSSAELSMQAYWSRAATDLMSALRTSAAGLTQSEAEKRLVRFGENRVTAKEGASTLRLLLRQYESPLVLTPPGSSSRC